MLSEAEREAGGGDTSPDPPGEGYATRSMRGSAHSPQGSALCPSHRKDSEQQEGRLYSPDTWGL